MHSQVSSDRYLNDVDLKHFRRGELENLRFWSRFNEKPDFTKATILDVGSGWGRLCVDMAASGAQKVVGLDTKGWLVDFANRNVEYNYPHLVNVVEFKSLDLKHYDDNPRFDIIVSKDSFEHFVNFAEMLKEMKKRLKSGGRIYSGFGPIYTSPYGDHDRRRNILKPWGIFGKILALIPWAHIFMEPALVRMYNRDSVRLYERYQKKKIVSMRDLELNMLAWSDYFKIFQNSGLDIVYLSKNNSPLLASRILSKLAKITYFEDYCIHNVYIILEKPVAYN